MCKRRFFNAKRRIFLQKLFDNDPTIHSMLKKPAEKHVTPVSKDAWNLHLHSVLRRTSLCHNENEVDREQATQQFNAATAPQPNEPFYNFDANQQRYVDLQEPPPLFCFPTETELFHLVSRHISAMKTNSSPGFDAVSPAFIKNAYKRVPRQQGRGTENVHVLAPHVTSFFQLLLQKARVPNAWKEAKLTPIHKKGPVISPKNYRMIAVSAPVYRLYSNVLSIIQDWYFQHG